jgi:DNA-directed RNA polymerase specialized sigma24 family protein
MRRPGPSHHRRTLAGRDRPSWSAATAGRGKSGGALKIQTLVASSQGGANWRPEGTRMQPPNPQVQFEDWWRPNAAASSPLLAAGAGGDSGVAGDALQETGRYIWRRWADYQPAPSDTIAFRIIGHRVIDQLRSRAGLTFPTAETAEPMEDDEPEDELALQEALQEHQACVEELPDPPEQPMRAVHLLHQAGQSDRQIAAALRLPYTRARRLRMQANLAVRTSLMRRTPAALAVPAVHGRAG